MNINWLSNIRLGAPKIRTDMRQVRDNESLHEQITELNNEIARLREAMSNTLLLMQEDEIGAACYLLSELLQQT